MKTINISNVTLPSGTDSSEVKVVVTPDAGGPSGTVVTLQSGENANFKINAGFHVVVTG